MTPRTPTSPRTSPRTPLLLAVLVLLVLLVSAAEGWLPVPPGPKVHATRGEVWPKPASARRSAGFYLLRPSSFQFLSSGRRCSLLEPATSRYLRVLRAEATVPPLGAAGTAGQATARAGRNSRGRAWRTDPLFRGYLTALQIDVQHCEEWPLPGMDETCAYCVSLRDRAKLTCFHSAPGVFVSSWLWTMGGSRWRRPRRLA